MSSKQIGIEDARKTLGTLVDEARNGTEVVLTRHNKPIARIVPIEEPAAPTIAGWVDTFRTFATVPTIVDTLGLEDRSPGLTDLGRAQLAIEASPFADLVKDIDAFFGGELDSALTGPESKGAETEVRRIIAEHVAKARTRLAVGAAILPQTDWANPTLDAMNLAHVALQRAADQRFVEVASPAAKAAA